MHGREICKAEGRGGGPVLRKVFDKVDEVVAHIAAARHEQPPAQPCPQAWLVGSRRLVGAIQSLQNIASWMWAWGVVAH